MPNLPSVQEIVLANVPYTEDVAGSTARPSLEETLKDGQETPTDTKALTLVDQTLFLPVNLHLSINPWPILLMESQAGRVALIVFSITLSFAVGVLE